jgi:hypothetical protein
MIRDTVFGELEYTTFWKGYKKISFFNREADIALMIDGEDDGIFSEGQYNAYTTLLNNWDNIQRDLATSILDYYIKTRIGLGYAIEENEDYPEVESEEQIIAMITIVGITVPYEGIFDGRTVGIAFDCTWDAENGVGVLLVDEKIIRIGYQDTAF